MAKITIVIENGKIKAVEGLSDHMSVEVRNYDIRNVDGRRLSRDENGKLCEIVEWHEPE